ncbi:MAG: DUF1614 domain-containing protein [Solirubrobacteraceae bacterium]
MTPHPGGNHHEVVPHRSSDPPPPALLLLLSLAVIAALLWGLFLLGGIEYAYHRIGIPEGAMFGLIFAELAGSAINIPIKRLHGEAVRSVQDIQLFGMRYRIPVIHPETTTTLAVNLGGAVIPTAVSVFLLVKYSIWWQGAVGVTVVALIVHLIARPVEGVGIAVPGFIPPLVAAGISLAVAPHMAAPVAFVSGTLGTLIGADLMNIGRLRELGGGMASIGGAGTFDGVFLSGIVAVLLVSVR